MKLARVLTAALDIATVAAIGYATVAIVCVARFGRRKPEPDVVEDLPPVSVIVPLHGDEPDLEENLRSFALQDYPGCQLVLGVARADDRALAIAQRVAAALPDRNIEINVGEVTSALNPKLANVLSMMRLVRHKVLILADSDTRVDPAYVRSVTAPLRRPGVGAVTCLFAGDPHGTFSAKLGAMFINEQFIPSVLVNELFGSPRHCLGPTNAVSSAVLSAIGGFEALAPHLADDFMLGNKVSALGLRVVISRYVIRTIVTDPTLAALWNHELRWHRTIRGVRPAGYAGMFLTYPVPLALLALILAPRLKRVAALLVAIVARIALQRISGRVFGVATAPPWLVLPRDLFGFAVWACGLTGKAVRWRGAELHIEAGDVLAEWRGKAEINSPGQQHSGD
ncbi:MAG TPA: bacteriohopanetetrol glucosamine biosynthesis glycosyltransferase HpnI [Candidatus Baltobacteraceae bacterium]|nr:bacteriohopanetetrol glucosamine biosynthesis glycosyltransferase HpnI [Candidatus Baltobacteraceae bacterium]